MSSAPPPAYAQPAEPPPPAKGGCLKAGLIGCGAVALLCVLAFVGFALYARKNPGFFLDMAMNQIERNYGPDVTEADKEELRKAVDDFKEALRTGRADRSQSSGWSYTFRRSSSGKLSHDDVQDLIRTFRKAAGKEAAPATTPPAALKTPA